MGLFNRLKDRLRIGRLRHCSHFMIDPVRQLRVVTTLVFYKFDELCDFLFAHHREFKC